MRLKDKTAIVTGGGAGIGRAICLRFAAEGARVVVGDIRLDAARETVDLVRDAGGTSLAVQVDAAEVEQAALVVSTAVEQFGGVDILINNAGLSSRYAEGDPLAQWDKGIEQTLSSAYRMTDAAMPSLLANGDGAVVCICSIAGTVIGVPVAWYAAAKAGLVGLTRHLAATYGKRGLRANALCLGAIETERTRFIRDNPRAMAVTEARTPIGRMGRPDEVAAAALFLASGEASLITGQVLIADGGCTSGG